MCHDRENSLVSSLPRNPSELPRSLSGAPWQTQRKFTYQYKLCIDPMDGCTDPMGEDNKDSPLRLRALRNLKIDVCPQGRGLCISLRLSARDAQLSILLSLRYNLQESSASPRSLSLASMTLPESSQRPELVISSNCESQSSKDVHASSSPVSLSA